MKLTFISLILLCLVGCQKIDYYLHHRPSQNPNKDCDISQQRIVVVDDSSKTPFSIPQFTKTYDENGKVKTLNAVFLGTFGQIDTVDDYFTYSGNEVNITQYRHGLYGFDYPYPPDTTHFKAYFEANTGHVTKIDTVIFKYEGNRLIEAGLNRLEYDSLGNLTYLKHLGASFPGTHEGLQYRYDYSKKAGTNDFYQSVGLTYSREYCLAEVMGWLPEMCKNVRTSEIVNWGGGEFGGTDYILQIFTFSKHAYNQQHQLISFWSDTNLYQNDWICNGN